ncbi:hypothetical protein G5S52_14655 [Grimontia sp. S25]|uniref:Lipoprotein n=1 Tax=Grimontia sedimenti TaxID=2711294 RepID=A0A6M1RMX2_9GAMM|nr:hypothetical protein [Grimontia sedimenti]NGN98839.1 hypothetical protein [Grimontia sedimenti]
MQKYSFFALTMLLAGCGGGGGGGDNPPQQANDSARYQTNQLKVDVNFEVYEDGKAEVTAYARETVNKDYIPLGAGDSISLSANGRTQNLVATKEESIEGSGISGGEYYELVTEGSYPEYTVTFSRANPSFSDAASINQSDIPTPFTLQGSFSNEVIDLTWSEEADHYYVVLGPIFVCDSGATVRVISAPPQLEDFNGSYSKSLQEIFGQNQSELTQGDSGCLIEVSVAAYRSGASNSSEVVNIYVSQDRFASFDVN